jgi:Uma2 family endonuclease
LFNLLKPNVMMNNSISTAPTETREHVQTTEPFGAEQEISLEQRTNVTVEELEKLSLDFSAELYNGRVVYKMPNLAHAKIQNKMGHKIEDYLESNPIGVVFGNGNYRLWPERNKESRAPDVSFILNEHLPKDLFRYPAMAPDLAVEILSPGNSFEDIMEKVDDYLAQGAKLVWVVISRRREVLVCTAQSKYIVKDKLTAPELLPGFELPVKDIFVGLETRTA